MKKIETEKIKFSEILGKISLLKNNEEKNDLSASLRPFGTHNSRYLQGLCHILLRYRYGERQISANVLLLGIITAITTTTQAMPSIVPITSTTGSVENVIRQTNKPVKYKGYKLLTKKERAKLDAMCNKVGSGSYYFQQTSVSWSGEVRYTTINSYGCRCARDRPWNQDTKQCDIPNPKNNPYFIGTGLATGHINSTVTSGSILLTGSTNPQKDTGYALCIDKCVSRGGVDFINTKAARTFDEAGKYQYFWKYAKSAVNIQCVAQCKIDNPNY